MKDEKQTEFEDQRNNQPEENKEGFLTLNNPPQEDTSVETPVNPESVLTPNEPGQHKPSTPVVMPDFSGNLIWVNP